MGQKRTESFFVDVGLPVLQLGRVDAFDLFDAVDPRVVTEFIDLLQILFRISDDEGTRVADIEIEILRELRVHPRAPGIQLRLEGPGMGIVAGVHHPAVALRRAHTDVVFAL